VKHLRFYPRRNPLPHALRHRLFGQGVGQAGEAFLALRQFLAQYEAPAIVLNSLMGVVRVAGKAGIPGLYVTEDPGAVDAAAKMGSLSIRFGLGWAKSHSFHTGQTPVMKYNRQLMQAIMWDRIHIADIVGVEVISLDDAPRGYGEFDAGISKKFVINSYELFSAV
jgi:glutathione-independent formaldehyde dehydrogenase